MSPLPKALHWLKQFRIAVLSPDFGQFKVSLSQVQTMPPPLSSSASSPSSLSSSTGSRSFVLVGGGGCQGVKVGLTTGQAGIVDIDQRVGVGAWVGVGVKEGVGVGIGILGIDLAVITMGIIKGVTVGVEVLNAISLVGVGIAVKVGAVVGVAVESLALVGKFGIRRAQDGLVRKIPEQQIPRAINAVKAVTQVGRGWSFIGRILLGLMTDYLFYHGFLLKEREGEKSPSLILTTPHLTIPNLI